LKNNSRKKKSYNETEKFRKCRVFGRTHSWGSIGARN